MTRGWRPRSAIRAVSIGVILRESCILAMRVCRDDGGLKGVRPPGGGVEFGERARNALEREFAEEFGVELTQIGAPVVLENIFEHEGTKGHEIVFAFPARLPGDASLMLSDLNSVYEVTEDGNQRVEVGWTALSEIRTGAVALYPDGLANRLGEFGA